MATPRQPPQQENKPAQPHTPPPDTESLRPAQPHLDEPPATSNGGGDYGDGGTSGASPDPSAELGAPATPGSGDHSADQPPADNKPDEDPQKSGTNTMAAFFVLAIPFVAGAIAAIASLPLWAIILGVVLAVGALWALLYPDQFQKMIEDAARAAGVGLDRLKELMDKWFSENKPEDQPERKENPPGPGESPVWKDAKPYKGKTKTNGENGKSREYYEWDYTHNDIEVYDSKGNHLGSKDPVTGEMYKNPVPGRKIKVG
ncbi:colicin E3/pyocin S6 family cytotoxin [Nocardia ninae]|nr:colicin E3/pyocin S6 family cytotoxin [Nocardia ninae]